MALVTDRNKPLDPLDIRQGLKEFLKTPLPVFNGRCAFDLLQLGDYEPVISALASDFEGTGF